MVRYIREDPKFCYPFSRVSGIDGVRGTHIRNREVAKPKIPFWVKIVVTSFGHMGKSSRLVPVHTGVTPKKDLWKHLCVEDSCGESKSQSDSKGRLRMILRSGDQAEPVEVGVLRHVSVRSHSWIACRSRA
jgi:hypothetical protein